jgi:CubicO group peptidase (beta-lactamase class C family)
VKPPVNFAPQAPVLADGVAAWVKGSSCGNIECFWKIATITGGEKKARVVDTVDIGCPGPACSLRHGVGGAGWPPIAFPNPSLVGKGNLIVYSSGGATVDKVFRIVGRQHGLFVVPPGLGTTTQAVEMDPKFVGRFRYSGGGFTVVQQLIEDVSGVPFAQAAREAILDPAGMTRSTFLQPPPAPLRDSTARTDWRFYPECAAAGLWTSPGDLARFVSALQAAANGRGGSLTRHTGEAMTAPHITLPPRGQWTVLALLGLEPPLSHGLGLFVREQRFINLGGAAGFFSALAGSNEDGTGAVVMTSGCRPALVLRVLLELSDAQAWNGFRASRGAIKRRTSDLLLRVLS